MQYIISFEHVDFWPKIYIHTVFSRIYFLHPSENTIKISLHKRKINAETIRNFQDFSNSKKNSFRGNYSGNTVILHLSIGNFSTHIIAIMHHALNSASTLTHIQMAGAACDSFLKVISGVCTNLQYLDISDSFVSNKGLYYLAGVTEEESRSSRYTR